MPYSRSQLLFLHTSPLVQLPDGMPALKDWFRTENVQLSSRKDSETSFPVGSSRDRRFRWDTDDGGSAGHSFRGVAITQLSQMGILEHDPIRATDRDRDRELAPKPRLAFLGPLGTYSHQAAFEYFGDSVEYVARPTIAGALRQHANPKENQFSSDVQQTLSACVPFGVVPQENSTNGSVVETYNVLRIPVVGQETFVRGVAVFGVKHSLVIRRGVEMENIENVLSHEQALGQCREWLAKHLPRASLVPVDSTASAAKRLLSAENGLDPMKCAAICSSVVITIYEGLEILEESIQDGPENFTRFYILSHGLDIDLPEGCPLSTERIALLRFQAPLGDLVKPMLNISRILSTLDVIILRIDRRPSFHGRPFDNVYFLEVGAILGQNSPKRLWANHLEQAVGRVKCMGVEVEILGYW